MINQNRKDRSLTGSIFPFRFPGCIAAILTVMLVAAGCVREPEPEIPEVPDYGDNALILTLKMPSTSPLSAYSMTVNDENVIETIDVLVFKVAGGISDDIFLYHVEGTDINDQNADGSRKQFRVELNWPQRKTEKHRYVILANMRDNLPAVFTEGQYKEDILKQILFDVNDRWPARLDNSTDCEPMPMWAETAAVRLDRNSTGADLGDIRMLRAMARIDVGINYNGDTPQGLGDTFYLESVHVFNASTVGRGAPSAAAGFTGVKILYPTVPDENIRNTNILKYTETDLAHLSLESQIYLAEAIGVDDTDWIYATALVIGGRYSDTDGVPGTNTSYYRVDFEDAAGRVDILRNHRYRINITSVIGEGWSTPEEAFKVRKENMEVELITWDEGEMDVIADGLWVLRTPSIIDLGSRASQLNMVDVFTNCFGGWIATFKDGETYDWLTIRNTSGLENAWDVMEIDVTENNTGLDRQAVIDITAGRMTKQVLIRQKGGMALEIEDWVDDDGFEAGIWNYTVTVLQPEMHALRGVPNQRPYLNTTSNNAPYLFTNTVVTDFPKNNAQIYNATQALNWINVWVDPDDFDWLRVTHNTTVLNKYAADGTASHYQYNTTITVVPEPITSYGAGISRTGKVYYSVGKLRRTILVHQDIDNFVVPKGYQWWDLPTRSFKSHDYSMMIAPGNQLQDGEQNWYVYMNLPNRYPEMTDYEANQVFPARRGSCGELNENNFLGYNNWRLPTQAEVEALLMYCFYSDGIYHPNYAMNSLDFTTMDSFHNGYTHYYYVTSMNTNLTISSRYNAYLKANPNTIPARCIREAPELD